MDLIQKANKECDAIRKAKHPYKAPECFPDPAIESTQVLGALIAIRDELIELEEKIDRKIDNIIDRLSSIDKSVYR